MYLEVADFVIHEGRGAEFDQAIERGVREVIAKAKGFKGFKVQKGVENPHRYLLMIYWETIENHMVDFRESAEFATWRSFVGPYFAEPPKMEHFTLLTE